MVQDICNKRKFIAFFHCTLNKIKELFLITNNSLTESNPTLENSKKEHNCDFDEKHPLQCYRLICKSVADEWLIVAAFDLMFACHHIFDVTGNLSVICYRDVLIMLILLLPLYVFTPTKLVITVQFCTSKTWLNKNDPAASTQPPLTTPMLWLEIHDLQFDFCCVKEQH